jgi:hypothetical protein
MSLDLLEIGVGWPLREPSRSSGLRSVPKHNSLWTHKNESLFPSRPESSRQNPEESIERFQSRSWMSSFQCRELLTMATFSRRNLP